MPVTTRSAKDRALEKINVTDSCWLWTGALNDAGYGRISSGGRGGDMLRAHRVVYEIFKGRIPAGLELDHLCRVRHCVNPEHLEPVLGRVNRERGIGPDVTRARHQAQTHCKYGHEFTTENTARSRGQRVCRSCKRIDSRRRREAARAAV